MGIRFHKKPQLDNPILIASWPGIGNIGVIAVDTLIKGLNAEEFGEIEPWDFFYPKQISVRKGILEHLTFPNSKFYFKKTTDRDLIFFIGEEQPADEGGMYAEGKKAYQMANLVLDVAEEFRCRRIYTSGAAISLTHHTLKPRVWTVPNSAHLIPEVKEFENSILMSEVEGRRGYGSITGLNGLLLGAAKKRGFEAICVMGEIPVYLQEMPIPYPKASKSVLEVLSYKLKIELDLNTLDNLADKVEIRIEEFYRQIPSEIKSLLEKLRHGIYTEQTEPRPITEEDKKRIMEDIDQLFKKRGGGD